MSTLHPYNLDELRLDYGDTGLVFLEGQGFRPADGIDTYGAGKFNPRCSWTVGGLDPIYECTAKLLPPTALWADTPFTPLTPTWHTALALPQPAGQPIPQPIPTAGELTFPFISSFTVTTSTPPVPIPIPPIPIAASGIMLLTALLVLAITKETLHD